MKRFIKRHISKRRVSFYITLLTLLFTLNSCSDFFDQDSTYIIDAKKEHLNNATDTIYSLTGILNKVQAIADRTVLLGEARGDLVTVTDVTPADLRAVANFNIGDDNMYNNPLDYYAIINNCNYFIAKADIELKNSRNQFIFKKEYAEVKAIRAWTYLQLVTTYGRVPFVTEPIMTKEESELAVIKLHDRLWDAAPSCLPQQRELQRPGSGKNELDLVLVAGESHRVDIV